MKKVLNLLVKKKFFPWLVQFAFVLVTAGLVYGGWNITTDDRSVLMQLRNTNLANALVWAYWWPLLILVTIFWGRLWCMVCPVEFVTRLLSKIGLKKEPPKFMKSYWVATLLYAFISIVAVRYWDIHRVPHLMAMYLLLSYSLAIIVGLIFKERTFCRFVCPINILLAFYSLLSKWGIHVEPKTMKAVDGQQKSVNPKLSPKLMDATCPSQVNFLDERHDKRRCQLCMQCVKKCPANTVSFSKGTRSYYLLDTLRMKSAEYAMAIILIAYSVHEAIHKLPGCSDFLKAFAGFFKSIVPEMIIPGKIMDGLALFVIFPCLCIGLFALLNTVVSKVDFKTSFKYGIAFLLPLGALGELTKGLNKIMTRLPYLPSSLADPIGLNDAEAIAAKEMVVTKIPYTSEIIFVAWCAIFAWGMAIVLKKIKMEKNLQVPSKVIFGVLALLYAIFCGFYPAFMKVL